MAHDDDPNNEKLLAELAAVRSPHEPGSPMHLLELGAAPAHALAARFAQAAMRINAYLSRCQDEPAIADHVTDAADALQRLDLPRIARQLAQFEACLDKLDGI